MGLKLEKTELDGLVIIRPHEYSDNRGSYVKYYESNFFKEHGINRTFSETSDLVSKKGSLRGLHYQSVEPQAKLVHVIKGIVFDVALDLRRKSETFGKYYCTLLSEDVPFALFIPEGFAHGYVSLTENSVFTYQCSGKYIPLSSGGILWNSPELKIPWPLKEYEIDDVIVTDKDKTWPTFGEYRRMERTVELYAKNRQECNA